MILSYRTFFLDIDVKKRLIKGNGSMVTVGNSINTGLFGSESNVTVSTKACQWMHGISKGYSFLAGGGQQNKQNQQVTNQNSFYSVCSRPGCHVLYPRRLWRLPAVLGAIAANDLLSV